MSALACPCCGARVPSSYAGRVDAGTTNNANPDPIANDVSFCIACAGWFVFVSPGELRAATAAERQRILDQLTRSMIRLLPGYGRVGGVRYRGMAIGGGN